MSMNKNANRKQSDIWFDRKFVRNEDNIINDTAFPVYPRKNNKNKT